MITRRPPMHCRLNIRGTEHRSLQYCTKRTYITAEFVMFRPWFELEGHILHTCSGHVCVVTIFYSLNSTTTTFYTTETIDIFCITENLHLMKICISFFQLDWTAENEPLEFQQEPFIEETKYEKKGKREIAVYHKHKWCWIYFLGVSKHTNHSIEYFFRPDNKIL